MINGYEGAGETELRAAVGRIAHASCSGGWWSKPLLLQRRRRRLRRTMLLLVLLSDRFKSTGEALFRRRRRAI
jgi:hypothetical protein